MTRSRKRLDRGLRQPSIYSRTEKQSVEKKYNFGYALVLILFAGLILFVIFSPTFKIKNVTVGETQYVNREEINKYINDFRYSWPFGLRNNVIFLSAATLNSRIGEVDGVKSVKVIKKYYPPQVNVEVTEKVPVFVWETIGKRYLIDEKGYISQEFEDKFKDLQVVIDTKNVPVNIGSQVVTPEFASFVKDLKANFSTYTNSNIDKIEVPEITSEIKVTSTDKWYVLFDTTGTAKNQLVNLSRVLQEAKAKKKKIEYVDLRIKDRIFYK